MITRFWPTLAACYVFRVGENLMYARMCSHRSPAKGIHQAVWSYAPNYAHVSGHPWLLQRRTCFNNMCPSSCMVICTCLYTRPWPSLTAAASYLLQQHVPYLNVMPAKPKPEWTLVLLPLCTFCPQLESLPYVLPIQTSLHTHVYTRVRTHTHTHTYTHVCMHTL
jgi:hypothetical protein